MRIQLIGTTAGIGIIIVGGRNVHHHQEEFNGIFVKEILPDQLAERDGEEETDMQQALISFVQQGD